ALTTAFADLGGRLSGEITDRAWAAQDSLSKITDRLDETFAIQGNAIESQMQTLVLQLDDAFAESAERTRETLVQTGQQALEQLNTRVDEIAGALDSRVTAMDSIVGEKGERLVAAIEANRERLEGSASALEAAIAAKADA